MMHLVRLLLSWSVRRVLLFIVIVAAMVAFVKAVEAWQRVPALQEQVETLERRQALLAAEVERQRAQAEADIAVIGAMEQPMLRERLARVRAAIAAAERGRGSRLGTALDAARGDGDAVARDMAQRFRLQLLRREEALITARLDALQTAAQVNGLAGRIAALDARIAELERQIAGIERAHPLLGRLEEVPVVRDIQGPWRDLKEAREALAAAQAERQRRAAAHGMSRTAFEQARRSYFASRQAMRDVPSPGDALGKEIAATREQLAGHWASRAWEAVGPVLGWALWVMLLIVLVPPAVKAFWFYVLAPVAERLRPVRVGRSEGEIRWAGERLEDASIGIGSAVSRRLRLQAGDELLVRPEYLQSSVANARADSQLLLSRALPFGSLATGLFALTRIRADAQTSAAVSATRDMIDEVGVLEVPEGAALVLRPRSLVGIVQRSDRPLRLERVWRLGCPMAWLTLNLRHLVFHGPCALVLKGARGIALEPAAGGRRVAGGATIGWSAGLAHKVTRSETFLAYLGGKQSLFHDRFDGGDGIVVYEEMPRGAAKAGLFGRGLEGLGDGLLKIAGL